MRQLLFCFFAAILCASTMVFAQTSQIINDPAVASALGLLEAWIEARIAYDGWPGLSIGVVYDQSVIWSKHFGYADVAAKTPATNHTLYAIASNTKMFTAIGIVKLRDEGKLSLEDPVEKYLPWFQRIKKSDQAAAPIRIRHLLTHTAGLPRDPAGTSWSDFSFPSLETLTEHLGEQSTVWPTERRWKYSNLGVVLLGAIIAKVTGVPYERYVEQNILIPLGMSNSGFFLDGHGDAPVATGYQRRLPDNNRAVAPRVDLRGLRPAGGLWSCVADLSAFVSWQFRLREKGGFEVISGTTLREMQSVHWVDPDWKEGFGFGFIPFHFKESTTLIGHGGGAPGFRTDCTISPDDKIGVIVLANGDDIKVFYDAANSVSDRVFSWVIPAIRTVLAGPSAKSQADTILKKYVGKYRDWFSDSQIIIMGDQLVLIDPLNPPDMADMTKLKAIGLNRFRIEQKKNGFGSPGETLTFSVDEKGAVTGFTVGGDHLKRIDSW